MKSKHTFYVRRLFSRKSCRLWDNVEKYGGSRGRRWQYRGALHAGLIRLHAHASARARTHARTNKHARTRTHTHREICNTYCFSPATSVSWTSLDVRSYVHCLSCCGSYTGYMRQVLKRQAVRLRNGLLCLRKGYGEHNNEHRLPIKRGDFFFTTWMTKLLNVPVLRSKLLYVTVDRA